MVNTPWGYDLNITKKGYFEISSDKSPNLQGCDIFQKLLSKTTKEAIMKRKARFAMLIVVLVSLCFGISIFSGAEAQAQQKKVTALEGVNFDTAVSLADNIKTFVGKDLFVHLRSGKTVQGYVKSVGKGLLHLEKLVGKDFYDALIRIEDISAIEGKFRDMK